MSIARNCWQIFAGIAYFLALLALFPGMLVVQFGLELAFGVIQPDPKINMSSSSFIALGIGWLLAAGALVEFIPYSTSNDVPKLRPKYQAWDVVFYPSGQSITGIIPIQWIIILLYAGFLDGGLMFRGCLYSYVTYLIGPMVFFIRRGFAQTKSDLIYLKWAWLPIMTFGTPLFVSVSKGKWPIG
jgi:hypothetical protein